jgi:hypothetical protein
VSTVIVGPEMEIPEQAQLNEPECHGINCLTDGVWYSRKKGSIGSAVPRHRSPHRPPAWTIRPLIKTGWLDRGQAALLIVGNPFVAEEVLRARWSVTRYLGTPNLDGERP